MVETLLPGLKVIEIGYLVKVKEKFKGMSYEKEMDKIVTDIKQIPFSVQTLHAITKKRNR
jgi:hypothetical protein